MFCLHTTFYILASVLHLYTIYQHVTFNILASVVYGILSQILFLSFTLSCIFRKPVSSSCSSSSSSSSWFSRFGFSSALYPHGWRIVGNSFWDCARFLKPGKIVLQKMYFLGAFVKLRKATNILVVLVRPSAWNNLASTGRIFIKFDIWLFFESLTRKLSFY